MIYTIKKGNHSSGLHLTPFPLFLHRTSLYFQFKFHENCLVQDPNARKGWGKFGGFSQGLHQKNSYRFGWMPDNDKIMVTPYLHQNGRIQSIDEKIIRLPVNQWFEGFIRSEENDIVFGIKIMADAAKWQWEVPKESNPVNFGYLMGFYYGGNSTGPTSQELSMEMK